MRRFLILTAAALVAVTALAVAKANFGELYYDGRIVRTVVPPAASPQLGTDNLYVIMEGAAGQLPVAAVAPGDRDYRGGKWAFHRVTWSSAPYLLTSEADVLAAQSAGDVTIDRLPEMDFKCPIQP
jgi:hypothetical protein